MALPKPCDRCGERFQPATAHTKLCDDCHIEAQTNGGEKRASKRNHMKENKKYPYKNKRK